MRRGPVTGKARSQWLEGTSPVTGKARSPLPLEGAWAETSGTSETSGIVPGVALRTRNRLAGFALVNGAAQSICFALANGVAREHLLRTG